MSLSRCVVKQLGRLWQLAASPHRSELPTAVRKCWGASFGRQWSSSVAEDREHGTDGVPLRSVENLPTLGNAWGMLWRWFVPTDDYHEQALEASLSSGVKLYRVPIPFLGRHFITISSPKHVSVMFKGEGAVPCRPGSKQLEEFMVERGFGGGIAIA